MTRTSEIGQSEDIPQHSVFFTASETKIFLLTMLATVIAKGYAFVWAYSVDDYPVVLNPQSIIGATDVILQNGRFGAVLFNYLFAFLRCEFPSSNVLFAAAAIAASAALGTAVVRQWGATQSLWLGVAVASLVANHPYTAEVFTYRIALPAHTLSMIFLVWALNLEKKRPRDVILAAFLFALALSIYQLALNFAMMILLLNISISLLRTGPAAVGVGGDGSLLRVSNWIRNQNFALMGVVSLGAVCYLVVTKLLILIFAIPPSGRARLVPPDAILERAAAVARIVWQLFFHDEPKLIITRHVFDAAIPPLTRTFFLALLLLACIGMIRKGLRSPWRYRLPVLGGAFLFLIAAIFWSPGLNMLRSHFWPAQRTLAHVGILWAGVVLIVYLAAGPRTRKFLLAFSSVILLSFIGLNNQMLTDQLRLNARDALTASRIVGRLEAHPQFSEIKFVAVVGGTGDYPLKFQTTHLSVNESAFSKIGSRLNVLREVSGYDFRPAWGKSRQKAEAYCSEVEAWPDAASVTIQEGVAIVCLVDRLKLATRFLATGQTDRAISLYREAADQGPDVVEARLQLARAHRSLGNYEAALAELESLLAMAPDYAEPRLDMADLYLSLRQTEKAIAFYQEAVDSNPNLLRGHFGLAEAYEGTGKLEAAIAALETAIQMTPDRAGPHLRAGRLYLSLGRHEQAVTSLKEALRVNPGLLGARLGLAEAYEKAGDAEAAIAELEAAIADEPSRLAPRLQLAALYHSRGQTELAIAAYREVLKAYPNNPLAQKALAELSK